MITSFYIFTDLSKVDVGLGQNASLPKWGTQLHVDWTYSGQVSCCRAKQHPTPKSIIGGQRLNNSNPVPQPQHFQTKKRKPAQQQKLDPAVILQTSESEHGKTALALVLPYPPPPAISTLLGLYSRGHLEDWREIWQHALLQFPI